MKDNVHALPAVEPRQPPGGAYSMGYTDGMAFGHRCANERFFWFGVVIGCVISTVIALAILRFSGGLQ